MKQPTCLDPSSTKVIKIPPPSLPDSATSESTPATSESNPAPEEQKQSPQPLSHQETESAPKDAG